MFSLFNNDNSDSDGELKINQDYANIYDTFRQKEELHKLKARYGENATDDESSDSSSSEDEDENIENPQFDKEFLITLACLKNDDPRIYDKEVKFFSDTVQPKTSEDAEEKKTIKKKEKTLSIRDYERNIILERDGRYSSEDEDDTKQNAKIKVPTYVEEQKELKDSFKNALQDDDDDDDGLLMLKQKTDHEKQKEGASYKEWLKGQEVQIDPQDQKVLKPLRDYWIDPNLDPNEKFLRDYILNNKHIDKESYNVDLEYNHIIHDSDENLSEDERNIQKQEEFERKYNFRFEEPDKEFIKRYPRTMENSMRKKDTRRAEKRAEVKQRKEQEKLRKAEELKQLKVLARKELQEKIEKLKEVSGNSDKRFDTFDFDADFDPNEHDRKMKELFNDEYYAGGEDEDQKPEFPEIDEELDIEPTWDKYDPTTDKIDLDAASYNEPHCEDPDFNMDADYDESRALQSEIIENTKKRKRRRRSKFAELLAKDKPKFDPQQFPSYKKYYDEYYSLDYEDIIGDLPCRFKYREVVPNDYGLSIEEILMADERELNRWCSLKHALKRKSEAAEKNDVLMYKRKASNEALKQKILKSLYTEPEEKEEEEKGKLEVEQTNISTKKRRRKKKATAINSNIESTNIDAVSKETDTRIVENNTNKDKSQNNKNNNTDVVSKKTATEIAENGINSDSNSHNIKNNEKQDKDVEKKDVKNKNKKQKRKNKLNIDSESNGKSEKIKSNNENQDKNVEKKDMTSKSKKQKRKNTSNIDSESNNKNKKSKSNNAEPIISLNAERLKTYGINPKKLKNKLKYGNKKF